MKRWMKKIGILLGIFVAVVAVYFIATHKNELEQEVVYTSMEESQLPQVEMIMYGQRTNALTGYIQEMGNVQAREALTVLPSDRQLQVEINPSGSEITGIHYEIRSLDMERLVERTALESWDEADGKITAVLPIQNVLKKEKEYLLMLGVNTAAKGTVHYYTRILWTDSENLQPMIQMAQDFSVKTFQPAEAQSLVTYLEPDDTGDNSSLGKVTIHSNFSQLTWAGLDMEMKTEPCVTVKELDGIMAQIELSYLAGRQTEEGIEEIYEVKDNFTLKWNSQRIYLMDFERVTNEIFTGDSRLFSGKRIILGITNEEEVSVRTSSSGQFTVFTANRDLWSYDREENQAVRVFSFRSGSDAGKRQRLDNYGVKILQAEDNGDVDFLVYGYMNRGDHEGFVGTAMYTYRADNNVLEELFFIPSLQTFEEMEMDRNELSYLSSSDMLYLMIDRSIYGIDLKSLESMAVADGLQKGSYAISQNHDHVAWQEGQKVYQAEKIHMMNLETGEKYEISGDENEYLRCLGYVGSDFLYGRVKAGREWLIHGRMEDTLMYALEILGEDYSLETRYESPGYEIVNVRVEESRIHLEKVVETASEEYQTAGEDTIVCNAELDAEDNKGVGWYACPERRKVYFVQLEADIPSGEEVRMIWPKKISRENAGNLELTSAAAEPALEFYAYGRGRLLGKTTDFSEAVQMAHEYMGVVRDQDYNILWSRVNRENIRNTKDSAQKASAMMNYIAMGGTNKKYEDMIVLEARGCSLNQMLYFVDKGYPTAIFTDENHYLLITGFDSYNITLYNPDTGEVWKMGQNDASAYFSGYQNDFVCGVFLE